jgi:hypothetical protein
MSRSPATSPVDASRRSTLQARAASNSASLSARAVAVEEQRSDSTSEESP